MIKAIVAMCSLDRGIGFSNTLPWNIPSDLKHFKEKTTGCIMVMGYNTMKSLGRPLPNRTNIVVVRSKDDEVINGFVTVLESEALALIRELSQVETVWVIGGAKTYTLFQDLIDEWDITTVDAINIECDTYLDLDLSQFTQTEQSLKINHDGDQYTYTRETFIRKDECKTVPFDIMPGNAVDFLLANVKQYEVIYNALFGPLANYVAKTHPEHSRYHSAHHLIGSSFLMFALYNGCHVNGKDHVHVSHESGILTIATMFHDYFHQNDKNDANNIEAATDEFLHLYRSKPGLFASVGILTDKELERICWLINCTTYDFDNPFPPAPEGPDGKHYSWMRDIDQLYSCVYFDQSLFDCLYEDIGKRFGHTRESFIERNLNYCQNLQFYTKEVKAVYTDSLPIVAELHSKVI